MIVTVTLNPALDLTAEAESFQRGTLNRICALRTDAGGKGINVSRGIRALGGESAATGFLGGEKGKRLLELLEKDGISGDFVNIRGETRVNIKIAEGMSRGFGLLTELNEAGPEISPEELKMLLDRLEKYAASGTLFVLSGSVPVGVPEDIYRTIIEMVRPKGASVLLDADGENLRYGLQACPEMVRINDRELMEYFDPEATISEYVLLRHALRLIDMGVKNVVISRGSEGAFFLRDGSIIKCPAIPVKVRSAAGAGDAMSAALAVSWEAGLAWEETVRYAMAAASGAVETQGTRPPSRERAEFLRERAVLKYWGSRNWFED